MTATDPHAGPREAAIDDAAVNLLVGARIRDLRKAAGMVQAEAAAAIGVARSTFANIETGGQATTAAQLVAIGRAFGVNPGELLDPAADVGTPVRAAALLEAVAGMHRRVTSQHAEIAELVERHMAAVGRELERVGRVLPTTPAPTPPARPGDTRTPTNTGGTQ